MDVSELQSPIASATIAGSGAPFAPEPEWIQRAADQGYEWARVAWQRAASVDGAWFDAAKADAVVARWADTFRLTTKRFAGKPFRLAFWQEIIVRLVVGWKRPVEIIDEVTGQPSFVHVRLFQELRLWIPRKNGKSEFLAALAILFWAIEGETRGQGFAFAHDEAQAREVFDKMGDMVGYMPRLSSAVKVYSKSLWIQKLKSPFKLLPGKAKGKHGRAPTVTVGDEMHEWKSRDLANTLRQGEGTSLQPVRLYASTAGLKSQMVGKDLWDESQAILDGRIDQPTTLVVIFAADPEADWHDERIWRRVNPSIGLSPTIAFLRNEYALAQTASGEAAFRRYHLNQWVEDVTRWLPIKKWNACALDDTAWKRFAAELEGRDCHLTFDATKNFDFASLCARFPPKTADEKTKFIWKFWLPQKTIEDRVKSEKVPFDRWRDDGALIEIPGEVFVLAHAIKETREFVKKYRVLKIGYDPWGALEFYNRLVMPSTSDDERPLAEDLFIEQRMGTRTLGAASKSFEAAVYNATMDHGGHPVAKWMAGHCHIRFDENMGFVPAKKKSEQSIDGIMTAVMAEALAIGVERPPEFQMIFV